LFFGETPNDILVISCFKVRGDFEVKTAPKFPSEIALEYFPKYGEKLSLRQARRKLMVELDPNDSLSYLEAQLDIVTKIIIQVAEQYPHLYNVIPELAQFKAVFEETSVFNIKPVEDGLREMTEGKAKTRKYQEQYFRERENIKKRDTK
jgi:hypothetical protein